MYQMKVSTDTVERLKKKKKTIGKKWSFSMSSHGGKRRNGKGMEGQEGGDKGRGEEEEEGRGGRNEKEEKREGRGEKRKGEDRRRGEEKEGKKVRGGEDRKGRRWERKEREGKKS